MEQCFSGYCRALDASRVVMADTDDGAADCDFPACLHAPVCKIAAELREFFGRNGGRARGTDGRKVNFLRTSEKIPAKRAKKIDYFASFCYNS